MSDSSYVVVPASAPSAYWEGYATVHTTILRVTDAGEQDVVYVLATVRKGATGQSDARYAVDRLASGLHFANWSHTLDGARDAAHIMADDIDRRARKVRTGA